LRRIADGGARLTTAEGSPPQALQEARPNLGLQAASKVSRGLRKRLRQVIQREPGQFCPSWRKTSLQYSNSREVSSHLSLVTMAGAGSRFI